MTVLVNFGTGRSHGIGEGAVVYLTQQQQQQQKEECNLHIIYVRYSVNRLDCLAPELFNSLFAAQGDFHYHEVWVDRDFLLREARDGLVRPRLCEVLILSESAFRSSSSVQRTVLMLTL